MLLDQSPSFSPPYSSVVAAFQLQHYIRYRNPVFAVRKAELPVETKAGHWLTGPLKVLLNARGARYPVTLTKREAILFMKEEAERVGGGMSSEGPGATITLEPEVWMHLVIESVGVGGEGDPPPLLRGEIYLSNPRDVFTVPLNFRLSDDGSDYYLDNLDESLSYEYRTHWRGHRRVKRVVSALRSAFPGRR